MKDFDSFNRSFDRNWKIMNWVMGIFFLFFLGMMAFGIFYQVSGEAKQKAETAGRAWVESMYPNETYRLVCQSVDTNGDGYISCTARVGNRPPFALECAAMLGPMDACRLPRLTVPLPQ